MRSVRMKCALNVWGTNHTHLGHKSHATQNAIGSYDVRSHIGKKREKNVPRVLAKCTRMLVERMT